MMSHEVQNESAADAVVALAELTVRTAYEDVLYWEEHVAQQAVSD